MNCTIYNKEWVPLAFSKLADVKSCLKAPSNWALRTDLDELSECTNRVFRVVKSENVVDTQGQIFDKSSIFGSVNQLAEDLLSLSQEISQVVTVRKLKASGKEDYKELSRIESLGESLGKEARKMIIEV